MGDIITALLGENGLSATSLLAVVKDLVPFIVMIVPVALGIYFLRKLIKGAAKGKVRF